MATYKAVMRPALEYASSIWSPLASWTSINKLQVMQNAAFRTATGCTQDTHIQHLHDETLTLPIHEHLQLYASQYKQKTQHPSHPLHKHTAYLNNPRLKNTIFNNGRYTTNFPTDPHTVTTTDIKQTYTIYIHLLSLHIQPQETITTYYTHLHHTLAALKRYFPASLVTPLPNLEQINHPSSKYTYTKSTPKHTHHHYSPSVTLTHTTHIISSPAPTYAQHCHPWICGQTPLARWTEKLADGPQAGRSDSAHWQGSWEWVDNNNDNKREDRIPPTSKGQQQHMCSLSKYTDIDWSQESIYRLGTHVNTYQLGMTLSI